MIAQDLLAETRPDRLALADADISLWRQPDLGRPQQDLMQELITATPWRQEQIVVYGKNYLQPRLSAWYGNVIYSYSGIGLLPLPWSETLMELKNRIEVLLDHSFNSVLLNYYRDQNDSMGMHSDNEPELGKQPLIASLSLGEERNFVLKHKTRKDLKTVKLPLPPGSLLSMAGGTQTHWRHGIARQKQRCGARINLTFRSVLNQPGT